METADIIFAETAAYFELVASQIEESYANENNNNTECWKEKLEALWVKVQCLIENEAHTITRKNALQETQRMLKRLCENRVKERIDEKLTKPDEENNNRASAIEDTVLKSSNVTFDDIAGLEEAKNLLKEAIVLPLQFPHLFVGNRKPWKSILLYGPPGTGKSRMAQAVSSEISSTFYSVSSSDLLSSWFGESEKLIKELFAHARNVEGGKAIIFIDEIDSLCRKRDSKEAETTRRVKTELLKQLEGASKTNKTEIFFLCATNCPWELDTAFLRRFEKRIFITLPDRDARKSLFKIHLGNVSVDLKTKDWERLLDLTEGYSGSDLSTCIADALLEPVRHLQHTAFWKWSDDKSSLRPSSEGEEGAVKLRLQNLPKDKVEPRPVSYEDLLKSLKSNHRTITSEDLERYELFTNSFGQNG